MGAALDRSRIACAGATVHTRRPGRPAARPLRRGAHRAGAHQPARERDQVHARRAAHRRRRARAATDAVRGRSRRPRARASSPRTPSASSRSSTARTRARAAASGLGLTICRGIVARPRRAHLGRGARRRRGVVSLHAAARRRAELPRLPRLDARRATRDDRRRARSSSSSRTSRRCGSSSASRSRPTATASSRRRRRPRAIRQATSYTPDAGAARPRPARHGRHRGDPAPARVERRADPRHLGARPGGRARCRRSTRAPTTTSPSRSARPS